MVLDRRTRILHWVWEAFFEGIIFLNYSAHCQGCKDWDYLLCSVGFRTRGSALGLSV